MPSLFNQVKSIMSGIKGNGTVDLLGNLGKQIDALTADDALDPNKRSSYISIMRDTLYANSNSKLNNDDVIRDISKSLDGAVVSQKRIKMYDEIIRIFRYIPILSRAVKIFVDNILSPDDITKVSLKVVANISTEDDKKYSGIIDEYNNIIKKSGIEDEISKLISNVLIEGERFVEISTMEREFKNSVDAYGIKLQESPIATITTESDNTINLFAYETPNTNFSEDNDGIEHIMEAKYKLIADEPSQELINQQHKGKSALSARKIRLTYHNPRNIVIIRQKQWIMGYLYIDKMCQYKNQVFQDEKPVGDALIDKLVRAVQIYLKDKTSVDIPDDLKDSIANILKNNTNKQDMFIRFIPLENMQHFKIDSIEFDPYGESYFYNLLPILRMYISRLIASTIYRLARAGKHMLIDVDVSGTNDARNRIEEVKRQMKMREVTGADLESIDKVFSHISTFEDLYVPSKDGKRTVNIETFDMGGYADRSDEDTALLKNILTGIEIPPSLLGVEEFTSGRNTLTQESIVFARTIVRLQSLFTKSMTELIKKIYIIMHKSTQTIDPNYEDVIVSFPPPKLIQYSNKSQILQDAKNNIDLLTSLGVPENVAKKMFLPDIDWDKMATDSFGEPDKEENQNDFSGFGDDGTGGFEGNYDMANNDFGIGEIPPELNSEPGETPGETAGMGNDLSSLGIE